MFVATTNDANSTIQCYHANITKANFYLLGYFDSNTAVNQAPQGTSNTVTTLENVAYVFQTADFGFSDPNDSPANNLLAVEITTLPGSGSLTDNGIAVTAGQFVSASDIAAGKLVFNPAAQSRERLRQLHVPDRGRRRHSQRRGQHRSDPDDHDGQRNGGQPGAAGNLEHGDHSGERGVRVPDG